MRWLVLVTLIAACGGGDPPVPDALAHPDASAAACLPSGTCENGPTCGGVCCDRGHQCVEGECLCGDSPACGVGDTCEAAGPIGKDGCGAVCCGFSGPCPQ